MAMDQIYFQEKRRALSSQLQKQRGLQIKAAQEKNEKDRWVYYGNCRYLEGQIDLIDKMIAVRNGYTYS